MLRLPKFEFESPTTVREAVALLVANEGAVVVAGGTDIVPNMKHEIVTPSLVVSLARVEGLRGITRADASSRASAGDAAGWLTIGAMTPLAEVADSALVRAHAPALAQAAGLVAGPQLRTMGTLGGNVLLDTRCQWINQSHFWRSALGFCLKKDGTKCHVVEGGSKCVAAASNDTAPPLMTLGAELVFEGAQGRRVVAIDDLWVADGIQNKKLERGDVLVAIRVPPTTDGHHGAYGKLRDRGSIDYPLLGVAVRLDVDAQRRVKHADVVVTALQARPLHVKKVGEALVGVELDSRAFEDAVRAAAELAHKQCHPLPNIPGDPDHRREMVPVYVRRTLLAAARREGPVHHV